MPIDKPSNPEDEYFAKEQLEKLQELRQKLDQERKQKEADQRRAAHWMRCPKCGGQMTEQPLRDVMVDVCNDCDGIYFDKGELDMLVDTKSGSLLKRIVQALSEDLNYGEGISDKPGSPRTK